MRAIGWNTKQRLEAVCANKFRNSAENYAIGGTGAPSMCKLWVNKFGDWEKCGACDSGRRYNIFCMQMRA